MTCKVGSVLLVGALLAGALTVVAPADAAGEPPCHATDEWETPARIEVAGWCRGLDRDHAFWVRPGERVNVFGRATSGQDLEICLVNATGVTEICHDTGGPGNAETINEWVAGSGGWWIVRVFPVGLEYLLSLSVSSFTTEDDCGNGGDASESFSTARVTDLPRFAMCTGALPAVDLADFYKADLEIGGTLQINTTVPTRLCLYAPRGSLAGACADVAADGSVLHTMDESGMWRFVVKHRPGLTTGDYELGAIYTPPNHAPAMVQHACSPQSTHAGDSVTCTFRASEPDGDFLYYMVDWGDGSPPQRVPVAGYATQAIERAASHGFPAAGSYLVRVNAIDNRTPPMSSPTATVSVEAIHRRPILAPVTCAPAAPRPGDEVTCTLLADDDSTGVAYDYNWGDGTPNERIPEVGVVAPGIPQTVSRTFLLQGTRTFAATATDDGSPAASSTVATRAIVVAAAVPSHPIIDCGSAVAATGAPLTCQFRSTDADSPNISYTVDWGDGNVQRVPPTGYTTSGVLHPATHAYPSSGYRTLLVSASDDSPFPQTSTVASKLVTIGTVQMANGSNVVGTPVDVNRELQPGTPVVDGTWVALHVPGRGDATTPVRLTVLSGSLGGDLDVRFYDEARSNRLDLGECSRTGNQSEACNAPAGAHYALVRSGALAVRNDWRLTYVY